MFVSSTTACSIVTTPLAYSESGGPSAIRVTRSAVGAAMTRRAARRGLGCANSQTSSARADAAIRRVRRRYRHSNASRPTKAKATSKVVVTERISHCSCTAHYAAATPMSDAKPNPIVGTTSKSYSLTACGLCQRPPLRWFPSRSVHARDGHRRVVQPSARRACVDHWSAVSIGPMLS